MSTPEPIHHHLVSKRGPLSDLLRHCRQLMALDECVRSVLSPAMATHVRVANYDGGRLVLQVDSPAWQSRLRFEVPRLGDQLRRHTSLRGLEQIIVSTRPRPSPAGAALAREVSTPRAHSPEAVRSLRMLARSGQVDTRLADALERLASHLEPPPED